MINQYTAKTALCYRFFTVKMYFQAWVPAWTSNNTVKWDLHLTVFGKKQKAFIKIWEGTSKISEFNEYFGTSVTLNSFAEVSFWLVMNILEVCNHVIQQLFFSPTKHFRKSTCEWNTFHLFNCILRPGRPSLAKNWNHRKTQRLFGSLRIYSDTFKIFKGWWNMTRLQERASQ